MVIYTFHCYSLNSCHPVLPPLCPRSVLYVCVSIPALQIGSSVPFFLTSNSLVFSESILQVIDYLRRFMMYSAYKLNKQGDNIQPWHTPFPIWNQYVVLCPVLTVASWPAYKFLKRQIRWSGIPISFRIFHSLLWSTQSKALAQSIKQKSMFFWNSLAFSMIQRMLAIWSLVLCLF